MQKPAVGDVKMLSVKKLVFRGRGLIQEIMNTKTYSLCWQGIMMEPIGSFLYFFLS